MAEQAIELRGVTKRFGQHVAVDQLDLVVPRGSIYGFIGPNGSGKTTTLRMILRIFHPDRGSVVVLGQSHGNVADDRLGYLPEERGLYKRMRVRDLLAYYAQLKGHFNCRADIQNWLVRLDAAGWADKKVDALSKGMAQKVQFIAAVIARPELVILDEPFSGLDPVNMEMLRDAVLELRNRGATVVFSTHDMAMAERMCDTIFMIFRGHKVLDGTLDAIQAQYPADRVRVQLEDPQMPLPNLTGVSDVQRDGRCFEFRLDDVQRTHRVLQELTATTPVVYFQVVKPSLHDIFVRIARPEHEMASNMSWETQAPSTANSYA
ncbi:MAG TPA: ATP-binding cassette domain-containing protein [Pirellulaceae bacterium]|nr:ATP-binding cassette domain-containing protein [Pirellulaceae bacterium]